MSDDGYGAQYERLAAFGLTLVKEWLAASPSEREDLRRRWPALADALDGLTWHPGPPGVGTGTPEAPKHPQNRSEGPQGTASDRARRARGGRGGDLPEGKFERAARQAGDMHEPRPYPASRLHFE